MKKIILIFSFIILIFPSLAYGISFTADSSSVTPSPIASLPDKLKKIQILKDKVATRVAEIRKNEKAALYGEVNSVSSDKIILSTKNKGDVDILLSTEDTTFYSLDTNNKRSDSAFDKIKEGTLLTVFGYYDESQKQMDAKYIYITPEVPFFIVGKIADIDRKNFTLTVKTQAKEDWIIDIETYTKTVSFTKANDITKSGFSKLLPDDLVHVTAIGSGGKEKNRASALRILVLSDFSSISPTPFLSPTSSPTPSQTKSATPTSQ